MSTIKNGQVNCKKGPGTSFQSPALSQNHLRSNCHTAHYNHEHNILRLFITLPIFFSPQVKRSLITSNK